MSNKGFIFYGDLSWTEIDWDCKTTWHWCYFIAHNKSIINRNPSSHNVAHTSIKLITSTDVENPPESSVAVTTSEYTCGCRKSSKSNSLASFTIPDVGPILNVPAPWPCAFKVYRISRSANDLALTEMMLKEKTWLVNTKSPFHKLLILTLSPSSGSPESPPRNWACRIAVPVCLPQ